MLNLFHKNHHHQNSIPLLFSPSVELNVESVVEVVVGFVEELVVEGFVEVVAGVDDELVEVGVEEVVVEIVVDATEVDLELDVKIKMFLNKVPLE